MAKINDTYDIGEAFEVVENELMASMIRNMKRHRIEEIDEKKEWEMWQALQLKSLEQYKKANAKRFQNQFRKINGQIESLLYAAREQGGMEQEMKILRAIKKGFRPPKQRTGSVATTAEFFKLNDRKLDALIKATQNDFQKAETAVLRMANDQYRKIIYNAQVYANTGAGTYEKAVDMATKDFLSRGINCIEYTNGARHTIADYASMAIRTASKRAYLQGEGEMRKEWGISTVIMNKRGNPCPKCLPFVGKVLIDDVWSGGKASDGPYPLMSSAIAAGLYHPRCKDIHTTYFEGISTPPDSKFTRQEIKEIEDGYRTEQKQQYAKRQADRFGRLAEYSLDEDNQKKYTAKYTEWEKTSNALKEKKEDGILRLKNEINNTESQISSLKKEFEDITDGYSYDEWFKEFKSVEDGFGDASNTDDSFNKLKEIDVKIKDFEKQKNKLLHQKEKRKQLDIGYSGRVPDNELDSFNKKAFEQIKIDTGYSDVKAKEFQDSLKEYFGGDYASILKGENGTAQIIRDGIDRMPVYDGSISRGMTFNNSDVLMFSNLKIGDELPRQGIIESWTSKKGTAIGYSGISDYERSSVILECENNETAVGVQHISLFGTDESEVLSGSKYEVVEMIVENKYDYLTKHKEYLYFPEDLEDERDILKENVVCIIKVKEKS